MDLTKAAAYSDRIWSNGLRNRPELWRRDFFDESSEPGRDWGLQSHGIQCFIDGREV